MSRNVGTSTLEVIKGTLIKYFNNDFTGKDTMFTNEQSTLLCVEILRHML